MASQSNKEAKDLACIVAALRSSKTKLDIDYNEFMRLDGAPTKQAAQMRLYRLGKSLGVELTSSRAGGSKATKVLTTPTTSGKRKSASAKSSVEEEQQIEEDELEESPCKRTKAEKTTSRMEKLEDNSTGGNGGRDDEQKAWSI